MTQNIPYKKTILFSALALTVASSAYAQSNDDIGEVEVIQVTADISQRKLSELPTSALVIDQSTINSRKARHLQDLIATTPNLNFSAGASRGKYIQIRGIGERSQFAEPINPSVGLLLDDIDISGIGSLATIFDAQQVEVLSGPQSVATGMNSLGGIVKIVSNKPTDTLYAKVSAGIAQYGEYRLSGVYSNSLNDSVNARVAIQNTQADGFVKNEFLGRDDTNGIDETSASALFNVSVAKDTQLDINFYHFDIANGYDAFSLDNDNVTQSDAPGFDNADATAASIKLSHDFASHSFQASIYSVDVDTGYAYDEDWTYTGFHPFGYTSFDQYDREILRQGLDLKFASSNSSSEANYLLGASITNQEEDLARFYTYADADYFSSYTPSTMAIYGQYVYPASAKMNVTFAARAENFEADFNDSDAFVARIDDNLFAGVLSVDYDLGGNFVFASISRGYKAGGFNIDPRLSEENKSFDPEYNMNYEAGIKGSAFDNMANINLTFFYMKRDDAQVDDFVTFLESDENGQVITSFTDAIGNSGKGVNQGIELATTWNLSDAWLMQFNAGYLDATISDYTQLDGTFIDKREQAQAPKYTAYVSSSFDINEQFTWFIDANIKDDHRFSNGHDERSPFTVVVNTELTYSASSYSVQLWVKNVFDRDIYTRGFGGFSNDPRDEYAFVEPYYQFGQERQVGLSFSYTWE
ncbi:TonB-dependent receptor [Glaciecola sp. 2405UD65-10]|uniref:TonB-dependent receptor n=1 Tax=Glaciecola sp. 2405UD65-10 TaxID=3397244 RepID=UPI003B5C06C2